MNAANQVNQANKQTNKQTHRQLKIKEKSALKPSSPPTKNKGNVE